MYLILLSGILEGLGGLLMFFVTGGIIFLIIALFSKLTNTTVMHGGKMMTDKDTIDKLGATLKKRYKNIKKGRHFYHEEREEEKKRKSDYIGF